MERYISDDSEQKEFKCKSKKKNIESQTFLIYCVIIAHFCQQLPVDLLTSNNHPAMVLTSTPPPSPKRHSSEHFEKSSDDWSVTYKKLQPDPPSQVRSRKNSTKEFDRLSEYDDDDDDVVLRRVKRRGRQILNSKTTAEDECKLNLTSIVYSCGSVDSIELAAECLQSIHIKSGKTIFVLYNNVDN